MHRGKKTTSSPNNNWIYFPFSEQPLRGLNFISPHFVPYYVNGYYSAWNRLLSLILFPNTNYTPHPSFPSLTKKRTVKYLDVSFYAQCPYFFRSNSQYRCPFQHVSSTVCDSCHWMAITVHRMEPFALTSTQKPWQMKLSLSETVYVTKVDGKANGAPWGTLLG